jgi:hypothetical protein
MSQTKFPFLFFFATAALTMILLLILNEQNEVRQITGGISLARLAAVFILPGALALVLTKRQGLSVGSLGLKPTHLRLTIGIILALMLPVLVLPFIEVGHMGKLPLFILVMPLILMECFGVAIGWFGYFSPRLMSLFGARGTFGAALFYGVWMTVILVDSLPPHQAKTAPLILTLFAANVVIGIAAAFTRNRARSVWPAAGLVAVSLVGFIMLANP